jgi:hypothetical protein
MYECYCTLRGCTVCTCVSVLCSMSFVLCPVSIHLSCYYCFYLYCFTCLVSILCVLWSVLFCVFCDLYCFVCSVICIVLCVLWSVLFSLCVFLCLSFVYKCKDLCHQVETQFQSINILSYLAQYANVWSTNVDTIRWFKHKPVSHAACKALRKNWNLNKRF